MKNEEGKLYLIAMAILGNQHDAWDSLQQTAEQAWKKRSTLEGGKHAFPAWIKKILVNRSLNILKVRKRQIPSDPQEITEILDSNNSKAEPNAVLIWDLVKELGPQHREIIALRYLGDMPLSEIAGHLDISLGTVKSRLYTAHTRLRQKLQDNNWKGESNSGF
ncbi:MAG: RNA polymerase sigma factor [Acetobacterium sp.]|nr:RNA polymerase sigma factor [Acetobacterium sp.]